MQLLDKYKRHTMKILIDGKEVKFENDVKVIWEDTPDAEQELHMCATYEGIILDVIESGEVERTMSIDTEGLDSFTQSFPYLIRFNSI